MEGELVDRLAALLWRLRRAPRFEAAAYAWMQCLQSAAHDDDDGPEEALRNFVGLSRALPPLVDRSDSRITKDRQLHIGRMLEAMNHKDLHSKLARHEANLMNRLCSSLM